MQSSNFFDVVAKLSKEVTISAVIPGFEYSVVAAEKAANYLGCLSSGDNVSSHFTNKINFRQLCEKSGVKQPCYKKIASVGDLKTFFNNDQIILKPANKHASIGVVKINNIDEIEEKYYECTSSVEKVLDPERKLKYEYIAEDYIDGFEFSVECLIAKGEILFINFTMKNTYSGSYFAELGHIVPARLHDHIEKKTLENINAIIKTCNFDSGVLHSEWKVENEEVYAIECASRVPGDFIPELIEMVYGFNFFEAYYNILSGKLPYLNNEAETYASIQYFNAPQGILDKVVGLDVFEEFANNVVQYSINIESGEEIKEVKCSWDRIGYYIVKSDDTVKLSEIIKIINENVRFLIK